MAGRGRGALGWESGRGRGGMKGPCFEFRFKFFELALNIAGLKRALSAPGVQLLSPWHPGGGTVASARALGDALEF